MSESCNGDSILDGDISESKGGPFRSRIPIGISTKKFPPDPDLREFVKIPYVYLIRYDITPYLNGSRKSITPTINRKQKKTGLKIENNEKLHLERISQKCVVKLTRDDLIKLKSSRKSWEPAWKEPPDIDSDCSSCTATEMTSKCNICNKSYESEKKLLTHQRKKHIICLNSKPMKHVSFSDHVIIHEVTEYHKCRKCTKIFEDYRSLKLHTKQEHKKRKCYICNHCDRNFAERMIFKVHIKLHCDICTKLFPNKAKCNDHKRNTCRIIKLHPCKTCDKSFYSVMGLKDHTYEHNTTCLVCDVCKDQFDRKCSIAHHISFLHSAKRPPSLYSMLKVGNERLYICNFCDESSVERGIIENHVDKLPDLKNRAMTGYKDYYFCDVCMKKFKTEQRMLQHKWTHFLKTTDNSQKRQSILKDMLTPKFKTMYNVNEKLPLHFQPKLVLKRLDLEEGSTKPLEFIDIEIDINPQHLKKAIVNRKSKKTLISRHRCEICGKYFSNNYGLNRHVTTQHRDYESLRCRVCEETFVWPSLLRTHRCIRLHHPEMPFEDARPEIHFDNLPESQYFDDLNIAENEDYLHTIDFEIPAPVVELKDGDALLYDQNGPKLNQLLQNHMGYKLVMQEVPIEF